MKKSILILLVTLNVLTMYSQQIDCADKLSLRQSKVPYEYNNQSKSIQGYTGNNYEYSFNLETNRQYRIYFFASASFDNLMQFEVTNLLTKETLLNLPGSNKENKQGTVMLEEYYDMVLDKLVYPYLELEASSPLNLKVKISIPTYEYKIKVKEADLNFGVTEQWDLITEKRTGCLTIYIQSIPLIK